MALVMLLRVWLAPLVGMFGVVVLGLVLAVTISPAAVNMAAGAFSVAFLWSCICLFVHLGLRVRGGRHR